MRTASKTPTKKCTCFTYAAGKIPRDSAWSIAHDTLCVTLRISSQAGRSCPEDIQVVLHQNCTALRSRAGDTGSVAWRCSTFFAEHMLQQLWGTWPGPSLFHAQSFSACRVLELGAGTGVLPACLFAHPGWLHPSSRPIRWIATCLLYTSDAADE